MKFYIQSFEGWRKIFNTYVWGNKCWKNFIFEVIFEAISSLKVKSPCNTWIFRLVNVFSSSSKAMIPLVSIFVTAAYSRKHEQQNEYVKKDEIYIDQIWCALDNTDYPN